MQLSCLPLFFTLSRINPFHVPIYLGPSLINVLLGRAQCHIQWVLGDIFPGCKAGWAWDWPLTYICCQGYEWVEVHLRSLAGARDFSPARPGGLWGSLLVQWVPRIKRPGAWRWPLPSSGEVKSRWRHTSPHIWCHDVCRENSAFDVGSLLEAYSLQFRPGKRSDFSLVLYSCLLAALMCCCVAVSKINIIVIFVLTLFVVDCLCFCCLNRPYVVLLQM